MEHSLGIDGVIGSFLGPNRVETLKVGPTAGMSVLTQNVFSCL